MIWKLNGTIINRETTIIIYGKKSICIEKNNNDNAILSFLKSIEIGIKETDLLKYEEITKIKHLIITLKKTGLLIKFDDVYNGTVLERSYHFLNYFLGNFERPLEFIKANKHIVILGCGGVGANVSLNLLLSGFSKFTLIDCDKVEESNLNRQFPFTYEDIGHFKAKALKCRLLSYVPNAEIRVINKKILSTNSLLKILDNPDFVVCGIDTPPIKSQLFVANFSNISSIPVIFAGVGYDSIVVGPLLTNNESIKNYINKLENIEKLDTKPISGSLSSVNMLLTSIISTEIIGYFYKTHDVLSINKQVFINPFNLKYTIIENYDDKEKRYM